MLNMKLNAKTVLLPVLAAAALLLGASAAFAQQSNEGRAENSAGYRTSVNVTAQQNAQNELKEVTRQSLAEGCSILPRDKQEALLEPLQSEAQLPEALQSSTGVPDALEPSDCAPFAQAGK